MVNHRLIALVVVGVTLTANYPNSNSNEVKKSLAFLKSQFYHCFLMIIKQKVNKYLISSS